MTASQIGHDRTAVSYKTFAGPGGSHLSIMICSEPAMHRGLLCCSRLQTTSGAPVTVYYR